MRPRIIPESAYLTCILVVGLVVAAALVQAALERMVGTLPPFIIFYPTVAIVAMLLGGRAGVLATCLAALVVDYRFLPPIYHLKFASGGDAIALGLFMAGGLVMSLMATMVNRARRSAAGAAERARVGEQLREGEQRLSMAREAANLAIVDCDIASGTIGWDSRLWEFWGLDAQETVTLEAFLAGIHPEDRAAVCAAAETAKDPAGNGRFVAEHRVISRKDGCERWVAAAGQAQFEQGKAVRIVGTVQDITQRKRAEEALRESEKRFSMAFAASPDAMVISRLHDGLIREVNEHGVRLFGRGRHEMIGKRSIDLGIYLDPADRDGAVAVLSKEGRVRDHELLIRRPCGEIRRTLLSAEPVEIAGESLVLSVVRDITEQRQAEQDQELAAELLRMVNRGGDDMRGLVGQIVHLIRERTGFDAVGLRLRQGEDWPYYQQDGFSEEFLKEENFLCSRGAGGCILRDASGQAILECTCGVVLSGRTDPTMPCFSEGGSFWTNRSTELLALAHETDPRENPRNRCIHAGYQSVALIPVRANERILGLLQLNDRRPDQFTPERIRCFESLCSHLGLTLQRRQAEEALRASEQQFRAFFNTSAIGTAEVSPDGRIMAVNDRYCQITGYSREELLAMHPLQLSHPDDREHDAKGCMRHLRGELPAYDAEKRYVRKDGRIIWVRLTAAMSNDASGRPLRSFGIVQDITERKRAEEALRQSEQRLVMAKEAASLGMFDFDIASRTIQWDSRLRESWGLAPDEPVTLELFVAGIHPDDRAMVKAAADKAMAPTGDGRFVAEHRVLRKDGRECWHSATGQVSFEHGKPVRMVGTVQDITDRKRAEEALRSVSAELQRTLGIAATGLIHCSRDLRYLSVNPAYARMLGLTQEQIVGHPIVEVLGPAAFEIIRPYVERVLQGERFQYEVDLPLANGIKPLHIVYTPDQDQYGNVIGWVASITDISERRRADEELRAAKARAEQSQCMAESASRAKDHFLAVLSHELRTPLTPVLPALEELAGHVSEEAREDLEMIRRNVELEARLIDDLLDVTRIARGKIELHREGVELETILRRAAEVCAADIEARQLHFGIEIQGGPYLVHADPARLQQAFWNLLKNAIKFTPHGGCVGVRCCGDGAGQVVAEVKDSGIGIEPEALLRIFNAFEQVDRSVTRQFGGLGLGLAISKALVELHGGTIAAYSAGKGKGAVFTVRLPPLKTTGGRMPSLEPGRPAGGTHAPTPARPVRILLVEDHGDTAWILRRMLQARGHEVETAGDVATALALAQERSFDLLLSDLGLPDRSGLELMQELRQRGRGIPGIALSGFGQDEDIRRSREAGFTEHLTKPVNLGQLEAAIGRVAAR